MATSASSGLPGGVIAILNPLEAAKGHAMWVHYRLALPTPNENVSAGIFNNSDALNRREANFTGFAQALCEHMAFSALPYQVTIFFG